MYTHFSVAQIRLVLALIWITIILSSHEPLRLIVENGLYFFLGIIGALFANSTGAGGGVVFVPFFKQLNFMPETIVATSFAIQCCGMTAGALTWWVFFRRQRRTEASWQPLPMSLILTVPFSVAGILFIQYYSASAELFRDPQLLHTVFGGFSICLAAAVYLTIPLVKRNVFVTRLLPIDFVSLPLIACVGGAITAWLSVGVGELIAVYLIMRRFDVTFAIATAVILSAFSVWGGIAYHAFVSEAVEWHLVLFAGAGAIVGGMLAKHLVLFFSVTYLKVFFATWILILGVSAMPLG